MRKLFVTITLVALLIMAPATSAVAFLDYTDNSGQTNANADATADASAQSNPTVNVTIEGDEAPIQKDVTTVYNNGKGYRGFANPAEITYAPMPSYFGAATQNYNIQPAKAMVMFKDTYTRKQLEAILEDVDANVSNHARMVPMDERDPNATITVIFQLADKSTVKQRALITTHAKNITTKSTAILFGSMLVALNYGADLLYVTAEGAGSELRSFGWGIGLAYTSATIANDEKSGGVAAGGFGVSGGKAGYKSYPWIQSIALKKIE